MRVLISGGGVAGMTLAYWLHRHGLTPVVVERSPHGRVGGYGIDFLGTAYDVAGRMGITDRLTAHPLPVESVDFVDAAGRTTARLTGGLLDKIVQGPHLGLMHTTLEEALTEAVQNDVEIRYGRTIDAVRQAADSVEVTFADGVEETFDLLIGADGIHSATRELVFGPERDFARYLGYYLATYPVPDRYGLGPVRAHYTEPGRQVVVYGTGRPGEMNALFLFKAPFAGHVPRGDRLRRLHEVLDGMGWITPRLLADAPRAEEIFMDSMTQIVMPTWHRGRVALIGDACGSMTLISAQGVSMAMAGAYVLGGALRSGDHATAFRSYQDLMRPKVARRQRNARLLAKSFVPSTRSGLIAQNLVMRLILRDAFSPLLRRRFGVASILPRMNDHPTEV